MNGNNSNQQNISISDPGYCHTVGSVSFGPSTTQVIQDQFQAQLQAAQTDPNLARYRHQDKLIKLWIAGQLSAEELRWILTRLTN